MKKTITLIFAAAAMMLSFASCQKETIIPEDQPALRTITAEFEANAEDKTTLGKNGKTPQWVVGDVIRLLNSSSYEDITLAAGNISGNKITFMTTLTGTLYAVYPASATTLTKCEDGNITFTIPETQDGTFASANICVAKGDDKDNLIFSNVTSVFKFKQTASTTKVTSVVVSSSNAIAGTLTASFDESGMAVVTPSSLTSKKVKMNRVTTARDEYFLSVAPVAANGLKCIYSQSDLLNSPDVKIGNKTLVRNKIYACPTMDGRDYKIQTGTINGHKYVQIGDIKWATNNVAITASGKRTFNGLTGKTPVTGENVVNGDYFQWAAYKGYCGNSTNADKGLIIYTSFTSTVCGDAANAFTFKIKAGTTTYQFNTSSISPYYASSYTKYTGTASGKDGKTVLETEPVNDDVASICWGGTWRMPTTAEFKALYDCTKWTWNATDKGYYLTEKGVTLKADKSNAIMFFAAAGTGSYAKFNNAGTNGSYFSSSLDAGNVGYAGLLNFSKSSVAPRTSNYRDLGRAVRPVSD